MQCLLDRLDTMTMANSVEARVPFLEHELIEFINSVLLNINKMEFILSKIKSIFSNSDEFTEVNDTNKYLLRTCQKYLQTGFIKKKTWFSTL